MRREHVVFFICLLICAADYLFGFGRPEFLEGTQEAWVGALISGVMSLAGGIAGSVAANKQAKKVDSMLNKQENQLTGWRNAEMYSNYGDRADSRDLLRRIANYNAEQQKALDTNAIKQGATEEAKIANAARLNKNYADAIGRIAAIGQQHKDNVEQQYMAGMNNIFNARIQNVKDNDSAQALAKGLSGAGGSLGGIVDEIIASKKAS